MKLPGGRLYLKLLAWFIATSLLAIVATLGVVQPLWTALDETIELIPEWGQEAVTHYEQDGPESLRNFLVELRNNYGVHALLLNEKQKPLVRIRMPAPIRQRLLLTGNASKKKARQLSRINKLLIPGNQGVYHWHVLRPPPGPEQWRTLGSARLAVFLLVMALAALFFAYWLGRPIKRLREATEAMTAGQLTTRVDDSLLRRRDEIGELGRAFNRMIERVQSLVANKERLLRDVSHELRSPLARLEVALELARERSGDLVSQELNRIDLETQRLKSLIDQVMTLARLDDPEASLHFEPVELVHMLREICDDLNLLPDTTITLDDSSTAWIHANPALLRSAIENLFLNAAKYNREGSAVMVKLTNTQQWATLEVRDHGPGVPEEQLEQIFKPFYRTQEARTRHPEDDQGGYGVGLAIVQRVTASHGGKVRASNHPGGGLCVTLQLPVLRQ